jgi:hypothetical protein
MIQNIRNQNRLDSVRSTVMAKAIDAKKQFDEEENAAGALGMPSAHNPPPCEQRPASCDHDG